MKRNAYVKGIFLTIGLALYLSVPRLFAAPAPDKSAPKGPPPAPVTIATAELKNLAPATNVSGTVISRNDARLSTEVAGPLKKVAEVGDTVKENDVIARIDNTFVALRIEELKSEVEKEKAQLQFLRQELNRLRRLAKQNNAAQTQLEQTEAELEIARNNLDIAKTRLQQAREEQSRHVIRAPFAGVVAERYKRPGERVDTGDDVVRLIDPHSLEVRASVPLTALSYVREGSTLKLRSDSSEQVEIDSRVRAIVPVGDERSRLLDLRLDFTNPLWRVGQPVRVALPTAQARDVIVVPRDALVLRRDGTTVFRVNDAGSAEKVQVKLGIAAGDLIEVVGDIQPGDKVVIRGGERLRPGQPVSILNAPATGQAAKPEADKQP